LTQHIEEDFRYATFAQVANYPPADLIWKPHLPGFEFSQLLDQLNGQVISNCQSSNCFRGLIKAPGGTALWLAKHLSANEIKNELLINTEPECTSPLLLAELRNLGNVVDASEDDGDLQQFDRYSIDCIVLACRVGLLEQFRLFDNHPRLSCIPIIAYDPDRELGRKAVHRQGRYFMYASTWVCNGN
jgi:hypothetical protein